MQAAVRWLRANAERLKIDPTRIGAAGDSAGGHLAQCLGVGVDTPGWAPADRPQWRGRPAEPGAVRGQYLWPQRHDAVERRQTSMATADRISWGATVDAARHSYILASPFYWVTPEAAPTLIIHGTKDDVVPYEQATIMLRALERGRRRSRAVDARRRGPRLSAAPMPKKPTPRCTPGWKAISSARK